MEVECDSRVAQLQAAHEQKIRELTSDAESEGLAKLEAHRSLLARLTAVQKEAASLKFCHVQLVETRGECEALKQEMAGVVTRVTGACAKQEATIAEQQRRCATLEDDLRATTEILAACQKNAASLEEERLGMVEQLRGERELVEEWKGHEARRATEAKEWEKLEEDTRRKLASVTQERDRGLAQAEAAEARAALTQSALEASQGEVKELRTRLAALEEALVQDGQAGAELKKRLEQAEAEAKAASEAATAELAKAKAGVREELSKRTGEAARAKREASLMAKKAEEAEKVLVKLRDEGKAQEAQLLTALEKANAEKALAERNANNSAAEAAAKAIATEKLHQQLKQLNETSKQSGQELRRRVGELEKAVNQSEKACRELEGVRAREEEARREAHTKLGETERLLEEAQQNAEKLQKANGVLETTLAREKEEGAKIRVEAAASGAWAAQLESMEALMLKLSDNIRQKEIQCKQLQDTVQFGCEERKELQEQISQLRGGGSRGSKPANGNKSSNAVQLPNINDKRGVR